MTKDSQVFNLLEGILPMVNGIRFFEPNDVLALYAGIGIPSLRILEISQANDFCLATYYQIKAANPLRGMVEPGRLRVQYESLRGDAMASYGQLKAMILMPASSWVAWCWITTHPLMNGHSESTGCNGRQ